MLDKAARDHGEYPNMSTESRSEPIEPRSDRWARKARKAWAAKTKPLDALGDLEQIGIRLASLQYRCPPHVDKKRIAVFAGSHGIAAEGVSAYPATVTAQMVLNFLAGGAAINVLAQQANC
jgi:nicotinate-nucleotide--dimethylbenzimidazole phosphoribosyltransferase